MTSRKPSNRFRLAAVLVVLLLGAAPAVAGEPLIDFDTGHSLVSNVKALGVGDIVTIIIVESTSANATSKTDANAKTEISGGPGIGFLKPFGTWGLDTENKFKGDGKTSRNGNLEAEISVRIQEVLPDGNFRLTGTRMVEINGDRQIIEISGICRPRDISADNTILSTYISDAQIAYSGTGLVQDVAEPGLLSKIVNWIF